MDVVSLLPVRNLDSATLKKEFDNVIKAITSIGLQVLAISVDNSTPNRKFYLNELCCGLLKDHVMLSDASLELTILFLQGRSWRQKSL